MRDHSGQCPVQYLKNIGPAIEQSDWLILVIGPVNKLSRVIINVVISIIRTYFRPKWGLLSLLSFKSFSQRAQF